MPKKYYPAGVGMTPSTTELGAFVRARRLELDLRQGSLAARVRVAQTYISAIERGEKKFLDDRKLDALARGLWCDQEELCSRMPAKYLAEPPTELGKLIRSRREELGLTLESFAERMGITLREAKSLETRKNPGIFYASVEPLSRSLDLDSSVIVRFVVAHRATDTESVLGALVRSRRKELGMSIIQIAEKLGVSKQLISQIELGRCPLNNSDDMIGRLAEALMLDARELDAVRPARRLKQPKTQDPLGKFVATKRLEFGWTQKELQQCSGVSYSVISQIENGYMSTEKTLQKIFRALRCDIPTKIFPLPRQRKPRKSVQLELPL